MSGFAYQKVSGGAGSGGKWQEFLNPLEVSGPSDLTVTAANSITIHDVLVGEVWVASGQSNMEFGMAKVDHAEQEIAAADYPKLRFFLVKKAVSDVPLDDVQGAWVVCSPATIKPQSAAAYFFARDLYQKHGVPVAVINTYWGGTPAQSWTSMPTMQSDAALKFILDDCQAVLARYPEAKLKYDEQLSKWQETKTGPAPRAPNGPGNPNAPATLYN